MNGDRHVPLDRIHHPRYGRHLLMLSFAYAVGFLFLFEPWPGVGGDETYYFSRIPSLVLDGDIDLTNDFLRVYNPLFMTEVGVQYQTTEGHMADFFPVGPSLLDAPFWLLAYAIDAGLLRPPSVNPASWIYRFSVSFSTALYSFLGLILCWRIGCRFFSSRLAASAAVFTFFSSIMVAYAFQRTIMSHPHSFFATALFLYVAIDHAPYATLRGALYLGVSAGLMVLTRWQSAPFLFLPLVFALWPQAADPFWRARRRRSPNRTVRSDVSGLGAEGAAQEPDNGETAAAPRAPRRFAKACAWGWALLCVAVGTLGFALSVSPQLFVWKKIFGSWIVMPQAQEIPLWPKEFFQFERIFWREVLFSGWAGLYHWHPLLVLSTIGLILMSLRRPPLGLSLLACVAATTIVNGIPAEWAGGGAVGPRRFALLIPFFCLGTAYFLHRLRSRLLFAAMEVLFAAAVVWNVIVLISAKRMIVRISPLLGTTETWSIALPEIARHPLRFFGDSLLLRYLQQGTPPLEPLLVLLLMALLFPVAMWGFLRRVLPVLRKWRFATLGAFVVLLAACGFDFAVWRSESRSAPANRAFRRAVLETAPLHLASPEQLEALAQRLELIVPAYKRAYGAALKLAAIRASQGRTEESRRLYEGLASRSYYAGRLGLFNTAGNPAEKQAARDQLAQGETADPITITKIVDSFIETGQIERARDWLDRTFISPESYWFLRAKMAADEPDLRLAHLYRALSFQPVCPWILEELWFELRKQEKTSEAREIAKRLETVGQEQMFLYETTSIRHTRERFYEYLPHAAGYACALARIHQAQGLAKRAAREWSLFAHFSIEPAAQRWGYDQALAALESERATPLQAAAPTTSTLSAESAISTTPTLPAAPDPSDVSAPSTTTATTSR